MKKSELINIIKKAVREELNASLPKLLSETKNTNVVVAGQIETDPVKLSKRAISNATKPQKKFSKNEAINKILNETQGGVPHEGSRVGGVSEITDFNGNPHSITELREDVSKALTRDYSSLLSAIAKKKNG